MKILDRVNRKIFYELDRSARASYARIAKGAGVSSYMARYRLESLLERGVIGKPHTVINFGRLGYAEYRIFLKLSGAGEQVISRIICLVHK